MKLHSNALLLFPFEELAHRPLAKRSTVYMLSLVRPVSLCGVIFGKKIRLQYEFSGASEGGKIKLTPTNGEFCSVILSLFVFFSRCLKLLGYIFEFSYMRLS